MIDHLVCFRNAGRHLSLCLVRLPAAGGALLHLLHRQYNHNLVCGTTVVCCHGMFCMHDSVLVFCKCQLCFKCGQFTQVLRCQPESGAVSVDQLPVALIRPRHEGHVSPLDPSALSRHLGTQDLQAPKVSTAGSVTLSLHPTIVAVS